MKVKLFWWLITLLPASSLAVAQTYDARQIQLLYKIHELNTDLPRYSYLTDRMTSFSPGQRQVAQQFLAWALNEMGLYDQAIFAFPLTLQHTSSLDLPSKPQWRAEAAVDVVTRLARNRRIVMINEAHHAARTRELTLALLPHLYALGFRYLALEALSADDTDLMKRGYPVFSSGTEYLHEPIYGEIVREAIRLGFKVVAYDSAATAMPVRESEQAQHLYQRVFQHDPNAKLFVHAGFAHIDKAVGRLGNIQPLAMQLADLTGYTPLSLDQTQLMENRAKADDDYHRLVQRFAPSVPSVLLHGDSGAPWSADPNAYDASILLPASISLKSFGEIKGPVEPPSVFTPTHGANARERPFWLSLGGVRQPHTIASNVCKGHFPCLVEARYENESDDAVPADRYLFLEDLSTTKLYLGSGRYRVRALDVRGKVMYQQNLQVDASARTAENPVDESLADRSSMPKGTR